ncbi:MAG: hypothetical protein RL494_35 [Bacteroidota bacterium]|jgi:hypothetical protein
MIYSQAFFNFIEVKSLFRSLLNILLRWRIKKSILNKKREA